MLKTPLLIAATLAVAVSGGAHAVQSTPSEFRGYQACLDANEANFSGLVTERDYLLSRTETGRIYYINATAWENGERVPVAFTCETTASGRLVSNRAVDATQFVRAPESVQVAGQ